MSLIFPLHPPFESQQLLSFATRLLVRVTGSLKAISVSFPLSALTSLISP